jgi:hypothetical protein
MRGLALEPALSLRFRVAILKKRAIESRRKVAVAALSLRINRAAPSWRAN